MYITTISFISDFPLNRRGLSLHIWTDALANDTAHSTDALVNDTAHSTEALANDTAHSTDSPANDTAHSTDALANDTAHSTKNIYCREFKQQFLYLILRAADKTKIPERKIKLFIRTTSYKELQIILQLVLGARDITEISSRS